ncbi:MAG: uncharacterized protein JWO31_2857 [Phycisphaerales bacterium]|nr:uncharacterized protein [Phycisphaerales bacterium]
MLKTYTATLTGDRIEWEDGDRPLLTRPSRVMVILLEPAGSARPFPPSDPAAVAAALDALAAMGGVKSFGDPAQWQRETRTDRPLPGRPDE